MSLFTGALKFEQFGEQHFQEEYSVLEDIRPQDNQDMILILLPAHVQDTSQIATSIRCSTGMGVEHMYTQSC